MLTCVMKHWCAETQLSRWINVLCASPAARTVPPIMKSIESVHFITIVALGILIAIERSVRAKDLSWEACFKRTGSGKCS